MRVVPSGQMRRIAASSCRGGVVFAERTWFFGRCAGDERIARVVAIPESPLRADRVIGRSLDDVAVSTNAVNLLGKQTGCSAVDVSHAGHGLAVPIARGDLTKWCLPPSHFYSPFAPWPAGAVEILEEEGGDPICTEPQVSIDVQFTPELSDHRPLASSGLNQLQKWRRFIPDVAPTCQTS